MHTKGTRHDPAPKNDRRSYGGKAHGRRRAVLAIIAVATLLVAALVGLNGLADAAYRRSLDPTRSLEQRVLDAQAARCLAPWSRTLRVREFVMVTWLGGRRILDAGDYSRAVDVLRAAYRQDVGDQELLALFRKAQDIEAVATTRKAHLQHGHEGPGSSLEPQDVER